jgi:hypothetical protein
VPPSQRIARPITGKSLLNVCSDWLSDCEKNHIMCNAGRSNVLPARLLCFADDGSRLVDTSGSIHDFRYATLSHCWGDLRFITLCKQSFSAFYTNVEESGLPGLFGKQSRSLGI